MSEQDFSATNAGTSRQTAPGKHRGPRFTWNSEFEATFFRSLCESVSLGLRDGSTFKPEAWERAVQALIDKHNAYANKGHLINKTDNARKKYRLWRGLREDPEFYYNAQTRMVTATDEAWARHLQKEPLARSLRARPFEHEELLQRIPIIRQKSPPIRQGRALWTCFQMRRTSTRTRRTCLQHCRRRCQPR
ncbi:Myb/SANT-like DNA-binding domain-containing protein [Thermothelomyces heterothallicus CBS 202.75]|uniref:Myb/SANT-like DNA-binding domain-containing protein n=1 Tax=Thermothelomyces heterothallicus CBS 202.75 TaxID=1149848 RepID=UPI003741EEA4